MKWAMLLGALLVSGYAQAGVYKCKTASGGVAYQGTPCQGEGEKMAIHGGNDDGIDNPEAAATQVADAGAAVSAVPETRAKAEAKKDARDELGGAKAVSGSWCEYAVSMTRTGEKDTSMPASWTFSGVTMSYQQRGAPAATTMPFHQSGDTLTFKHALFPGDWVIVSQDGGQLLIKGPVGGYYHLRPGHC